MSLDATFDIDIEKMDVKTMFLHGDIEEEIYMKKLKGFAVKGNVMNLKFIIKKYIYISLVHYSLIYPKFIISYDGYLHFLLSWSNPLSY